MRNRKNDIEKYLRGELSPSEMHALEREALSDPFLAEALEGVEHAGADNFLYDLHKLNKSVHDRMRRKTRKNGKTIRMWGWTSAVAATILLLAVSGFLVVKILRDQQTRERSVSTVPEDTKNTAVGDISSVASADSSHLAVADTEKPTPESPRADIPSTKRAREEQIPLHESKPSREVLADATPHLKEDEIAAGQTNDDSKKESASDINPVATSEVREQDSLLSQDSGDQLSATHALEGKVAGVETRHRAEAQTRQAQTSAPVAGALVEGKVTSEDGHVLPGVNVTIEGANRGTVTDGEGKYQLIVPEGATLVFGFIGFESQKIPATTKELNVTLEEDISTLSEVVVTGFAAGQSSEETSSFQVAEPDGGKVDFKTYLANAVRYPQEAISNKIEGKVTVRFTVEPNGKLTDFEVVKGIGSGCEEELIRAIQQGPYWKPSKRGEQPVKDKIRVKFKFNLPR